jgi:5-methylcytosine-specific restriction protein A
MTVARVCLEPGCARLTSSGSRCPEHERIFRQQRNRARDRERGSSTQRGYGSQWRKLSMQIIRRDGGYCFWCGLPGADTTDHVIAKNHGGSDDPSNLVAAHRVCNGRKQDRL